MNNLDNKKMAKLMTLMTAGKPLSQVLKEFPDIGDTGGDDNSTFKWDMVGVNTRREYPMTPEEAFQNPKKTKRIPINFNHE